MARDLINSYSELPLTPWSLWLSSANGYLTSSGAMALTGLQWKDVHQQCGSESQEGQGQGWRWASRNDIGIPITCKVGDAACRKPGVSSVLFGWDGDDKL